MKKKSFHTTQYDLNRTAFAPITSLAEQFPYYIVRFKLLEKMNTPDISTRFHTTQYDLNDSFFEVSVFFDARFHTTQYDLNTVMRGLLCRKCPKFPYYIVRFKRRRNARVSHFSSGFHTTQYDLNLFLLLQKRAYRYSFHTTQYDLNAFEPFYFFDIIYVSILHSTI